MAGLTTDLSAVTEEPFDVISVLSEKMAETYRRIPENVLHLSEVDLVDLVKPGINDYALRNRFDQLVKAARSANEKVSNTSIYKEIITGTSFYGLYAGNPEKVAFITRPVVHHQQMYQAIMQEGLKKLFVYVKNHQLSEKTAATFARIIEKAADRTIGPVVQRVHQHNTHQAAIVSRDVGDDSPEQLEERIKDAQAKLDKIKPVEIEARSIDQD